MTVPVVSPRSSAGARRECETCHRRHYERVHAPSTPQGRPPITCVSAPTNVLVDHGLDVAIDVRVSGWEMPPKLKVDYLAVADDERELAERP